MEKTTIDKIIPAVSTLLPLLKRERSLWIDYDQKADVLYLNLSAPRPAADAELTENDIIVRTENGEIIGFTVLNASRFLK